MTKRTKKTKEVKKTSSRTSSKKGNFTHIDRSTGTLLRKSELNKKKPWISPVSNQATVEELTQEEKDNLKEVSQ